MTPAEIALARELLCEKCGHEHPVWFAPNAVWNAVIRGGDPGASDEFSFLCPTCFIVLAEERGMRPTGWMVAPEGELLTATTWRIVEASGSRGTA